MRMRIAAVLAGLALAGCQTGFDRRVALHTSSPGSVQDAVRAVDEAARQSGFRPEHSGAGQQTYSADAYMVPGPTMGLDVRWEESESCVSIELAQPNVSRESDAFRNAWRNLML